MWKSPERYLLQEIGAAVQQEIRIAVASLDQ